MEAENGLYWVLGDDMNYHLFFEDCENGLTSMCKYENNEICSVDFTQCIDALFVAPELMCSTCSSMREDLLAISRLVSRFN